MRLVDVKAIAVGLLRRKAIPERVKTAILKSEDDNTARNNLFLHWEKYVTMDCLLGFCEEVMSSAYDGEPMQGLGKKMKAELDQAG